MSVHLKVMLPSGVSTSQDSNEPLRGDPSIFSSFGAWFVLCRGGVCCVGWESCLVVLFVSSSVVDLSGMRLTRLSQSTDYAGDGLLPSRLVGGANLLLFS